MVSTLTHHTSSQNLLHIQQRLPPHPKYLFLSQAIKIELERLYPHTKLHIYSYSWEQGTYWFAQKINRFSLAETPTPLIDLMIKFSDHVYLCYEGGYDPVSFTDALTLFVETAKPFMTPPLFVGEKLLIDEVAKYVEAYVTQMQGSRNPTKMFYMTRDQMDMVENMQLPPLPDGYTLGSSCPTTDSMLITSTWKHAKDGDEGETRLKLSAFPSSCVRFDGRPVAFEMISQAGQLTHLYVMEEHRGKGLGRIVELDLAKKTIKFGLNVIKCVELTSPRLIASTERLPYWSKVKLEDGSDMHNVFYEMSYR